MNPRGIDMPTRNLLDDLIFEQNRRGTRPASAAQLDPNAPPAQYVEPARDAEYLRKFGNSMFEAPPITSMWDSAFGGGSPRSQLRLQELTTLAAQRKLDLENTQRRTPMEDELLRARLEHQNASTDAIGQTEHLKRRLDSETMGHVTGFADFLKDAPPVNSPQYAQFILQGVKQFPRVATTQWGKDTLKRIAQEHDTIQDLTSRLPPGFDVSSVTVNSGGRPSVTMKPTGGDEHLEKQAKDTYKLGLGEIRNPVRAEVGSIDPATKGFSGNPKGDVVRLKNAEGKDVLMSTAEYEKFGGKYSGETLAARAPADKRALAEKALADPNAPEKYKEAARKLLGK